MPHTPFVGRTRIAYFSMEIALRPEIHSYAGGLGVLAGDTVRSCAELELPVVFVTLASRAGYFRQTIDAEGRQGEQPDWWQPADWCRPLGAMTAVMIEERPVWVRPWLYLHEAPHGHAVPVLLLDTDLEQNDPADREITHSLYGDGNDYRLKQEIVLGLGGIRILRALDFEIRTYHLNEGHAALLTLELLNRSRIEPEDRIAGEPSYDVAEVRRRCVFTTHTPVEAGHDRFPYALFQRMLPDFVEIDTLKALAGAEQLNMTRLAFSLSGYVNGVARRHAETTQHLFPGYRVHAVTNGVHAGTWAHPAFAALFDAQIPQWQHEPEVLVRALQLGKDEIWRCHLAAKAELAERVQAISGTALDPDLPILGFARRMTGYKRPLLLFSDLDRLAQIAAERPFQLVLAGKAHPRDDSGKAAIQRIHQVIRQLDGKLRCVFLPDYDMALARILVSGCDVWLNTPQPPLEASGTSGMKAALNGVLNLSVLDGWWIEACVDGVNGWAIGTDGSTGTGTSDGDHAAALYALLEKTVLPLWHDDPAQWRRMMRQAIGSIAYYFNSQRMMRRYATEAYLR
ncbi:starch phosphorylase [Tistlia consotensis]|uniref:glycogen phosphorylase n=1 Tax=Tistlia consotensis USBA 355 TaxID=560819 RepID=A0A1Y6CU85_9PROT|nr:alpha-glucan family phosphorylase [Tistlia consotensis]SMF79851.1 starch phosphorylase [Tistlia consotensis USBA 355]SNS16326.1 starch phosphorylase [Tistlia consotensis]